MIEIKGLEKTFVVYRNRMGFARYLVGLGREGRDYDRVEGLKGIHLKILEGEVHGIIGMNGAGKSTLLKILTGVLEPTAGSFAISGKVAALLELGTGFHPELTGRQNIEINGSIMGFDRAKIQAKVPEIEAFAELRDFFDRPVKFYSSGMYVRLAFSFAIAVDPDVLIIDEALAVGDVYFQQKCLGKIRDFKKKGTTILFVSHDLGAVKLLCDRVSVLSQGKLAYVGTPNEAVNVYNALLAKPKTSVQDVPQEVNEIRTALNPERFESGTREIEIIEVELRSTNGQSTRAVISGQPASLFISAKVRKGPLASPTCGILIRDRLGYDVFGTNTHHLARHSGVVETGARIEFNFDFPMNLGPGQYSLTVALHSHQSHVEDNFHWIDCALLFQVVASGDFEFVGVSRLEPKCYIKTSSLSAP